MNTISHKQAREWTHVRLDGQLDKARLSTLNTHLKNCAACRVYAAAFEHLDSELKQAYRERIHMQHSVLSSSLSTSSTIHLMDKQMRLKMKNKQIMNVATSLAFLALMAVAILGFSWIVSTRGQVIWPAAGTGPEPTRTPFPWTENNPLTSADQIEPLLNNLAERNVTAIRQSAWVHIIRSDQSKPGMLQSSYSDSWLRYPSDDRSCVESLTWVKERPESGEFLQIIVEASDGTYGDLIQLRSGNGQVMHLPSDSGDCGLKPELTPAGLLRSRLQAEQAASPEKGMAVQAWYAAPNGRPVFTVFATFIQPSKGNYTGITKETYSFDLESGVVLQYGNRMEWEDGSVFSESLEGYETEFLSEIPADVATQFEQYAAELKSYASGVAIHPSETTLPSSFDYTVRAGDTCGRLAVSYNVSVQSIVTQNNLPAGCIISVGQKLKIPYPTATPTSPPTDIPSEVTQTAQACEKISYTVQANDTLSSIATNYNVPPDAIRHYNGLSIDTIFWGQSLIIPLCERSTVTPTPSQSSEISPGFVVFDQQFISKTTPLTAGQTILQILRDLKRRQIERLSQPGWYVYGPDTADPQNWMINYYLLTHTIDQNGSCEFMSYYVKDGKILPQQLVLADGRWGMIGLVEGGKFDTAATGQINWNNGSTTDTCQVQNTETVSFIQNETDTFQNLVDGRTRGTYKAWTEQINGRKVFVLNYEVEVNGQGTVMDPDTRKLEPIEHTHNWVYFDLDWGTVLYGSGWQSFLLQNGKTIGSAPALKKIEDGYTFHQELPANLQAAYEKAVADLEAYLQK